MRSARCIAGFAVAVSALAVMAAVSRPRALGAAEFFRFDKVSAEPSSPAQWPDDGIALRPVATTFPEGFAVLRVVLDPGHGAPNNTGNRSCWCEDEQDFTLWLAEQVAEHLRNTGHFEVRLARQGSERTRYPQRVARADAWKAHAYISLHSDVRGSSSLWTPTPGNECVRSDDAPGFSVLWSDEASEELAQRRLALARAVAVRMRDAGFSPYSGEEYNDYKADAEKAGVFVDRHEASKRIYVLRKPRTVSVLVETHNALDPRETLRWREPSTVEAFSAALIAALVDVADASG